MLSDDDDVPTFIMPEDIGRMDNVAVMKLVEILRVRRLEARKAYEELEAARTKKNHEWIQEKLDALSVRFAKQLVSSEKSIDKLEELANKIIEMRLSRLEEK